MKIQVKNYTFDHIAKTITFMDYTSIDLDSVLLITNVTDNVIIYNFADPLKGGTVLNNVLSLTFDVSAMSDTDDLQIFYNDESVSQKVIEQNPIDVSDLAKSHDQLEFYNSIKKEEGSGELNTIDENLRLVLGTERLVTQSKKLNVNAIPDYLIVSKNLALVTNASFMMDVIGYASLAIQVTGTWTGTLTFECANDGGNFVAMNGIAVNGTAILSTTTANGIFRFNIAAITKVQVRFSTATTGTPIVQFIASPEPSSLILNQLTLPAITGAVTTTDSILPGSITTQAAPAKIIPVAPTLPTSGINNFLASCFPQIFQRLRVESAGSNRVPFKQEDGTDKMTVANDEERVLLQNILRQLEISNILKYQELDNNGLKNLRIPEGLVEY